MEEGRWDHRGPSSSLVLILVITHKHLSPGHGRLSRCARGLFYSVRIVLAFLQSLTRTLHGRPRPGSEWVRDVYAGSWRRSATRGSGSWSGRGCFLVGMVVLVVPAYPVQLRAQHGFGNPQCQPANCRRHAAAGDERRRWPPRRSCRTARGGDGPAVIGSSPNGVNGIFSGTNTANMIVQLDPDAEAHECLPADPAVPPAP